MQKIQELIKEGKLSESLMSDKNFVDEAKKIFKSENIEMDDEKLKKLISEIEVQLKNGDGLNDEELEQISGGVTGKDVARVVIKITVPAVSAFLGADVAMESYKRMDSHGLNARRGVYGAMSGASAGYGLAKIICSEFGLEEK